LIGILNCKDNVVLIASQWVQRWPMQQVSASLMDFPN